MIAAYLRLTLIKIGKISNRQDVQRVSGGINKKLNHVPMSIIPENSWLIYTQFTI